MTISFQSSAFVLETFIHTPWPCCALYIIWWCK